MTLICCSSINLAFVQSHIYYTCACIINMIDTIYSYKINVPNIICNKNTFTVVYPMNDVVVDINIIEHYPFNKIIYILSYIISIYIFLMDIQLRLYCLHSYSNWGIGLINLRIMCIL